MSATYSDRLKGSDKERYEQKLRYLHGKEGVGVLDPYKLAAGSWIDDVSLWPQIEFPNIYSYLVDTPGGCTREKLKAFESLIC